MLSKGIFFRFIALTWAFILPLIIPLADALRASAGAQKLPPPQTQPGLNGVEMPKPHEAPQGMNYTHTNPSAQKQQEYEEGDVQIQPLPLFPPGTQDPNTLPFTQIQPRIHGPYPSYPQVPQGRQVHYTPYFPHVPQDPNTVPFPQFPPVQVPYPSYPPVPQGRQGQYTPYFPQVPLGMQNPNAPFPQIPPGMQVPYPSYPVSPDLQGPHTLPEVQPGKGPNKLPSPQVSPEMENPHMPPQIPPGIQVPFKLPQIPPSIQGPNKPPVAPAQVPDAPIHPLPYGQRGIDDVFNVPDETQQVMEGKSPQNHLRHFFTRSGNVPVVFNFFTPIKVVNKDDIDKDVPPKRRQYHYMSEGRFPYNYKDFFYL